MVSTLAHKTRPLCKPFFSRTECSIIFFSSAVSLRTELADTLLDKGRLGDHGPRQEKFYNSGQVGETYFVHASREDRDEQNDNDKYESRTRKSFYHRAAEKISALEQQDLTGQARGAHRVSAQRVTPWVSPWFPASAAPKPLLFWRFRKV